MAAIDDGAKALNIVMEETMVPAADAGISIYVRNKRPAEMTEFRPERTVLFVHGSSYPAHTSFDLPLGGMSWMDFIAARGYDVYLLDLRGYGKSTRPREMDEKPEANAPIVRTDTAVKDVAAVADFIRKRRNIAKLNLIGWSWGTTQMAAYTAQNPDKVARLVLYAPQWIRTTPSPIQAGPGPLAAYRLVFRDKARERWYTGVPESKQAALIPAGWFEQWADATGATDPPGGKLTPPALRAPNGTLADTADYWLSGKPYYDPSKIAVPTLLVHGEWDHDTPAYMAQTLFPLLVNSPEKRYVQLAEGTHHMMMENTRLKLFEVVQAFLDEARA